MEETRMMVHVFARRFAACVALIAASAAATGAQGIPTQPVTPSENVSPKIAIAQIDVTCDTMIQQAKLITPVHVVLSSATWKIATDADVAVAERTKDTKMIADVWKQNGKYVWARSHTFKQDGTQSATQLCFRVDGTLARVRQALTIPSLDAADATRAYYKTDGSLIEKFGAYAVDDPAVATKIEALPYYKTLP
jgi:hypothetical protein